MTQGRRYDPEPRYPAVGGTVGTGLPPLPDGVLAIDGPAALPWEALIRTLPRGRVVDLRDSTRPWLEPEPSDPAFARAPSRSLADLVGELPALEGPAVLVGLGGALAAHAELADDGDPRASAVFASFGTELAEFLAPSVRDFRPDCVVVGGAIAGSWSHFGATLARALEAEAVPAARIDDAPLLGVALHSVAAW